MLLRAHRSVRTLVLVLGLQQRRYCADRIVLERGVARLFFNVPARSIQKAVVSTKRAFHYHSHVACFRKVRFLRTLWSLSSPSPYGFWLR